MENIILISEKQLAKDLEITERRVRELFKEHKYAPGEYKYPECIRKYIKQMRADTGDFLTQKSLAETLNLSEKTIRTLTEKNILKKAKNGKYNLKINIQNYLENYIRKNEESNKLKKIQRETQEFKLNILKDEYYPDHVIRHMLSDMMIKFKKQLIGSSRKIAIDLEQNPDNDVKETIEKNLLMTLDEFTNYRPPSNKES